MLYVESAHGTSANKLCNDQVNNWFHIRLNGVVQRDLDRELNPNRKHADEELPLKVSVWCVGALGGEAVIVGSPGSAPGDEAGAGPSGGVRCSRCRRRGQGRVDRDLDGTDGDGHGPAKQQRRRTAGRRRHACSGLCGQGDVSSWSTGGSTKIYGINGYYGNRGCVWHTYWGEFYGADPAAKQSALGGDVWDDGQLDGMTCCLLAVVAYLVTAIANVAVDAAEPWLEHRREASDSERGPGGDGCNENHRGHGRNSATAGRPAFIRMHGSKPSVARMTGEKLKAARKTDSCSSARMRHAMGRATGWRGRLRARPPRRLSGRIPHRKPGVGCSVHGQGTDTGRTTHELAYYLHALPAHAHGRTRPRRDQICAPAAAMVAMGAPRLPRWAKHGLGLILVAASMMDGHRIGEASNPGPIHDRLDDSEPESVEQLAEGDVAWSSPPSGDECDQWQDECDDDKTQGGNGKRVFMMSKKFDGVRTGYMFKTGDMGLGYYLDGRRDTAQRAAADRSTTTLVLAELVPHQAEGGRASQLPVHECRRDAHGGATQNDSGADEAETRRPFHANPRRGRGKAG